MDNICDWPEYQVPVFTFEFNRSEEKEESERLAKYYQELEKKHGFDNFELKIHWVNS